MLFAKVGAWAPCEKPGVICYEAGIRARVRQIWQSLGRGTQREVPEAADASRTAEEERCAAMAAESSTRDAITKSANTHAEIEPPIAECYNVTGYGAFKSKVEHA